MKRAVPCLLDTNVVSFIRDMGADAAVYIGSTDLAVSDTVVAELLGPMPDTDPKMVRNYDFIAAIGGLIIGDDDDQTRALARQIEHRYCLHQPPPSDDADDALIAATAIRSGRVLITKNWKHFHYIAGLRLVDARIAVSSNLIGTQGIEDGCLRKKLCCSRVSR